MRDLYIEQGFAGLTSFMEHVYKSMETGQPVDAYHVKLSSKRAGSAALLLQDPTLMLMYITPCMLAETTPRIPTHISDVIITPKYMDIFISRANNCFLMDIIWCSCSFSPLELQHLNAIWMYLQVSTVLTSYLLKTSQMSQKYPHNADILSHIQWLSSQLTQIDQSIQWVKAHQDTILNFSCATQG